MKVVYDKYNQPVASKVYIGTPNNKPICVLNGIDEESFSLTRNVNNTYEISFDVNRFIDINGQETESNGYDFIDTLMRIYVENIGWFCIEPPTTSNDGIKEIKSVTGQSAEIEMSNHHLNSLKINKGTTDSYEMLVDGNVEMIGDVEFAKEQIKFCNKENEELSLLHILLKESGIHGWIIGYVDDIPKVHKDYINGELVENSVSLSDEIGSFEFDANDLYSTLTQTISQFFGCVFIFDFMNFRIDVYRPENLGKNTNVNLGFRNVQVSNNVEINENDIYTRYRVSGGENLDIRYGNFGSNVIENLTYFLNEKYLLPTTIAKYKLWLSDVESKRIEYIENTRLYNAQQSVISELYDRLPLDDCSTDWSAFSDDELLEAKANYEAQLAGYESYYVDDNGDFDEEALQNSVDANDYYQIKDVILPSIQIEIDNREILDPDSDDIQDYIDSYLTNWDLYGLDELQVKLDAYENTKTLCINAGYDVPYSDESEHTEDIHNEMYEKYLDAVNQLNPDYIGGCREAYDIRKSEIDAATALQKTYDDARKEIAKVYDKEQWVNGETSFSESDLRALSRLYRDTTYTNENMFLTSSDNSVTAIDEQLKLLYDAIDDLAIYSQPQYTYTVSLDNFLAMPEFAEYTSNLEMSDFLHLGVRDDYVVKLRLMSVSHNPLKNDNNLTMTFSNMLRSASQRNDFVNLIGSSNGSKGGSRSGDSNDYVQNEGVGLTPALIQKLVSSGAFSNKVSQIITNEYGSVIAGGGSMSLSALNSKLIKVVDLFAENGFFEYLQTKLVTTDKIVSDSGIFNQVFIKEGTVVKELVAVEINGNLIKVGTIYADKLAIRGENGLYYRLNVDNLGELTVQEMINDGTITQDEFESGLHGDTLIKKTVTAEKIYVDDLNAFGATIGGFKITKDSIYSGEKSEICSPIDGIYQDEEGQFEVGNLNNYIRFYKYENGEFHLNIQADSIRLGSGDNYKTVEEIVNDEIVLKVADKQDILPVNIRYIRDWLNGNTVDATNKFVGINVMSNNFSFITDKTDDMESDIVVSSDVNVINIDNYTDNQNDTYAEITESGWHYIQLDLGENNTYPVTEIIVKHDFSDNRKYNHRLEVSSDGNTWYRLFDSDLFGKYKENDSGKIYYISDNAINNKASQLKLEIDSIGAKVQQNSNQFSKIDIKFNEVSASISGVSTKVDNINDANLPESDSENSLRKITTNLKADLNGIEGRVSATEGDIEKQAKEILNVDGWQVVLENVGIDTGKDVKPTKTVNVEITGNGFSIERSEDVGYKSQITGKGFSVGYDKNGTVENVMNIDKDQMYLSRVHVSNGVDHGTIKELPVKITYGNTEYGCLAFVTGNSSS